MGHLCESFSPSLHFLHLLFIFSESFFVFCKVYPKITTLFPHLWWINIIENWKNTTRGCFSAIADVCKFVANSINGTMNLLVLRSASSLKASMPFLRRVWKRKPVKLLHVSLPRKLTNTSYVVLIVWDEEKLHWMMVLKAIAIAVKVQRKANMVYGYKETVSLI